MRIALIGTRGVPARYGGFETAVEEVGQRLAAAGHDVTVYSRGRPGIFSYRGMRVVRIPAVRAKTAETLVHSMFSVVHAVTQRYDVAIMFNAANAAAATALKLRRVPYAIHVDGLEWKRLKWGQMGRRFYLSSERLATRTANALIADAIGIADYYRARYGAATVYIPYGTPTESPRSHDRLAQLGLAPKQYHLVVARFEPENFLDLSVQGYVESGAEHPLVVVGSAPYAEQYVREVHSAARDDARVRFVGGVWDQILLDELYANATTYIHGHSVGGTNPSLLRAMGHGAPVVALDVVFNREVLGRDGRFYKNAEELARLVEWSETNPAQTQRMSQDTQRQVRMRFDWDAVADAYAALCARLVAGGADSRVEDGEQPVYLAALAAEEVTLVAEP